MLRCGPSLKRPSIYRQIKFTHGYIWFPMLPVTSVHNPKNMNGSEKDLDRFPQITLTIWFEKIMKRYFLAFFLVRKQSPTKKTHTSPFSSLFRFSLNIARLKYVFFFNNKIYHMLGLSGTSPYAVLVYSCNCICIFVFACLTHVNIIFDILEQSSFQKYATC